MYPILLNSHASPMALIHPQPSCLGSESNPSAGVWTYGICIMMATSSSLLTPAWESLTPTVSQGGAGTAVEREWSSGLRWWERTGAAAVRVTQWGRGQVAAVGEPYSRWRRRAGGRRRSHRHRGGCCSAAAGTARG